VKGKKRGVRVSAWATRTGVVYGEETPKYFSAGLRYCILALCVNRMACCVRVFRALRGEL